ncbi:MAG: hypothetical protein HOO06_07475 [Bdellovibrionaceae bacterium]|jgi:hypothetical protein|nr:hypothetical protein [Pseudobdellovibrionaceae bacterium]
MKNKRTKLQLNEDFDDFLHNNHIKTPNSLSSLILKSIQSHTSPSHSVVFIKLLGIQCFIGIISLAFCPQFNLSLTNNYEVFHYLHHTFGANVCMAICGSIFVGSGAVFASYILRMNEVNLIYQNKYLYYLTVSLIAVSLFSFIGTDLYFKLAIFWIAGASLSGAFLLKFNRLVRIQFTAHYL